MGNFARFLDSLDHDDKPNTPKTSWIHTFYLMRSPNFTLRPSHLTHRLNTYFVSVLPRFSALRELSCRAEISVDDFDVLTRACGRTLTKLVVYFWSRSIRDGILQFTERLVVLEYLYVYVSPPVQAGSIVNDVDTPLVLPRLRMLAVDAFGDDMHALLRCLMRSSFPKLTSFAMSEPRTLDSAVPLNAFLKVHGRNLTDFHGWELANATTTLIFPLTPRLTHVDLLIGEYDSPVSVLARLPYSVSTVTLAFFVLTFPRSVEENHRLNGLLMAVENLPRPNMLRTVRLRASHRWLDNPALSWRLSLSREPEMLTAFAQRAANLLPLGIVVVDDEDAVLTDMIPLAY
jgi:hypothetical protein